MATPSDPSHEDISTEATAGSSPIPSTGLASLQPLRVAPPDFSPRTRVVLALRRIEFVRVVPSATAAGVYDIQVFYKSPTHHIPLSEYSNGRTLTTHPQWMKHDAGPQREPDAVIQRSLSELCRLHDELFQLARIGHKLEPCAFCLSIIEYCGYSRVKPQRSMTWLHSCEVVSEKLSVYTNELLQLVAKVKAFHADNCTGQESIPVTLHRFLQRVGTTTRRQSVSSPSDPPP